MRDYRDSYKPSGEGSGFRISLTDESNQRSDATLRLEQEIPGHRGELGIFYTGRLYSRSFSCKSEKPVFVKEFNPLPLGNVEWHLPQTKDGLIFGGEQIPEYVRAEYEARLSQFYLEYHNLMALNERQYQNMVNRALYLGQANNTFYILFDYEEGCDIPFLAADEAPSPSCPALEEGLDILQRLTEYLTCLSSYGYFPLPSFSSRLQWNPALKELRFWDAEKLSADEEAKAGAEAMAVREMGCGLSRLLTGMPESPLLWPDILSPGFSKDPLILRSLKKRIVEHYPSAFGAEDDAPGLMAALLGDLLDPEAASPCRTYAAFRAILESLRQASAK